VRQALFDMLLHAPWGGRETVVGARVLDVFAGTGALGLEALSRGASHATFIERDSAALVALRANIATCRAEDRCAVLAIDALAVPPDEHAPRPACVSFGEGSSIIAFFDGFGGKTMVHHQGALQHLVHHAVILVSHTQV
jgi:16S rRNA (guanine966-N2)-methyltransferase